MKQKEENGKGEQANYGMGLMGEKRGVGNRGRKAKRQMGNEEEYKKGRGERFCAPLRQRSFNMKEGVAGASGGALTGREKGTAVAEKTEGK